MAKTKKDNSAKTWEDCQQLIDEWTSSKGWVDRHTSDFRELSQLADGLALSNAKGAPIVGDVTLATSVRQIPRASIQQLPTFSVEVNGTKLSIPAYISDFIMRRVVFNQDTFGKGILSTMQIGAESALTFGFQAAMASLGSVMNDFGTTMKLIHYNDIGFEKGVIEANESGKFFVRTRVTRSKLDALIEKVKANPKSTWNLKALETLRDIGGNRVDLIDHLLSDARSAGRSADIGDAYDFITEFKVGSYAEITTFSPDIRQPLRKMKSKSKFGYPRVQVLVLDPAQLLPFGISRVRLATPAANYANIYLQSTAKMQLLNADPPVFQRGMFSGPVKLKRGQVWKSNDPNAEVKLQELSNSTLTQFENVLRFTDNQIYSIMGVTPGSVGAQNRSGAYQNKIASSMEKNVSDLSITQVTNILENFLRQYALTALDLYVSEQTGTTDLIVDDQCKNSINRLMESKYMEAPQIDPMTGMPVPFTPVIGDDNVIQINWKEFYDSIKTWTVDIDLSMSKDSMEDKKRGDVQDMLTVMSQTSNPNDPNAQMRIRELEDVLLEKTVPEVQRANTANVASAAQAPVAAPAPAPKQA